MTVAQTVRILKTCTHCGLDVPKDRDSDFCCAGCECVFKTISGLGLSSFYEIKQQLAIDQLITPKECGDSFSYLDDELFQKDYLIISDNGNCIIKFHVDGLHCAACVWLLEHLASRVDGVESIRVNFPRSELLLNYSPNKIALSKIAQIINQVGYYPRPTGAESKKAERKAMLIRLGVAGVCAGNTMMLAISVYQGWFSGIEQKYIDLFNYLSLLLALPSVFYCARPFYASALQGLRFGFAHMDLPISIGVSLGFIASCWNTITGSGHVYFDTICMLIFLLLFGRWLQKSGVEKAEEFASSCESLLPLTALKLENGIESDVYASSLAIGEKVRVKAGQRVAVDGLVLEGSASLDLSVITGESLPKVFSVGDKVEAGTIVCSGMIDLEVINSGSNTRIGKLLERTEAELLNKPGIIRATDRIAGHFVIAVLSITSFCACYWLWRGSFQLALENCLAILIISCPCALGMSAPIAISIGLKVAAKLGIAIKNSDIFEELSVVNRACLDKTGTLTTGRPRVENYYCSDLISETNLFDLCYSSEMNKEHPVASALRIFCSEHDAKMIDLIKTQEVTGKGLKIIVGENINYLGSLKWIKELQIDFSLEQENFCVNAISENFSPCVLANEKNVLGIFAVGDKLKADALDFVVALKARGISCEILSGDSQLIVNQIAEKLGIIRDNAHGELSPEAKLKHLSRDNLKTLMLGDGINDSAALAAASVGIAVFGGAEQSLKFADAYTNASKLLPVATLIDLSNTTLSTVKRNIAFSICYNVVGVTLAFCGLVNPLVAAVLMPISSFGVIGSSLMILKQKK